jgi:hypothetical protein
MKPSTPVVLYASDYGFHTGNILWRGHFVSTGSESSFSATLIGGAAFGFSAWLNGTFIGSWEGNSPTSQQNKTFTFACLAKGKNYVITVLQDHMGLEEDFTAAGDQFKTPRGIIAYSFPGSAATTVTTWKVTGNLGGEDVSFLGSSVTLPTIDAWCSTSTRPVVHSTKVDSTANVRAGIFPVSTTATGRVASPPTASHRLAFSSIGSPLWLQAFVTCAHRGFRTTFALNVPTTVDYPIAVAVTNSTVNPHYRAKIYVNGYQFGHYVNAIGPQTNFPIRKWHLCHPHTLSDVCIHSARCAELPRQ